jgi:hypothetical protein
MDYGNQFKALVSGRRKPHTDAQQHFVDVSYGKAEPDNEYERVWMKYLHRVQWERENGGRYSERSVRVTIDEGFAGSRDEIRKMRAQQFNAMRKRRRNMYQIGFQLSLPGVRSGLNPLASTY